MIRPWTGRRRIAVIPVWNTQVDTEPPNDWFTRIRNRLFYDPDPATGVDGSLQRYIQTISSGRAWISAKIFPTVAANDADTMGAGLMSLPPDHGFEYAMVVIPHSVGPHRGGFAWMDATPVNGISNFCRVPMYTDQLLTMVPRVGLWAMELLHTVTAFGDLYNVSPQMGRYDVMACACGTHPSAHTKFYMGWLENGAIRTHELGKTDRYNLHAVSLSQPPPPWRTTAVRVASKSSPTYFLIEARLRTDPYEDATAVSAGIPGEGVIIYEVQSPTSVFLRTATALKLADPAFQDNDEDLTVNVLQEQPGGFMIEVKSRGPTRCSELAKTIDSLRARLEIEMDMFRRKQLISALQQALAEYRARGCLTLVDPVTDAIEAREGADDSGRRGPT